MSDVVTFSNKGYETKSVGDFAEEAYLDYAMYVILDVHCHILVTDLSQCNAASFMQ